MQHLLEFYTVGLWRKPSFEARRECDRVCHELTHGQCALQLGFKIHKFKPQIPITGISHRCTFTSPKTSLSACPHDEVLKCFQP